MNKEELLRELSLKINSGELDRVEVLRSLNLATSEGDASGLKKITNFSLTKMLYSLGVAIAIIGIIIFVYQIWEDIGVFGRIIVTLGLGLTMAASGSMLMKQKPGESIGSIFHFIGGVLIPGGAMVALYELSPDFPTAWSVAITFKFVFAFYLLLTYIHRHVILTFFSILNGTFCIYLLTNALLDGVSYNHGDLYSYITMAIGASYLLLAHSFNSNWNKKLVGALYFFGSIFFLSATFSRVWDWDFVLWQILYFFVLLGGFFLSIYLRSRIILVMSTLFLIGHISYITNEYFADSLGWPIALVILGFLFIGLGYVSIEINKKYIDKQLS